MGSFRIKFGLFIIALFAITSVWSQDQYTIVFLHNKPDKEKLPDEEVKKIQDGHMANINRLAAEGKLLAAGPFDGGGGIFILNTNTKLEAENWLSTDPGVQAKRWNIEILPYQPRIGGVCPVGEHYEMTNYTFIRLAPQSNNDDASRSGTTELLDHYAGELGKNADIITAALLGDGNGGIVVVKGADIKKEVLESDSAVREGKISVEVKNLYIAKGSFCEK